MFESNELIRNLNRQGVKAKLIDNLCEEIQIEITTKIASYFVSILRYDEYTIISGNVSGVRDVELYDLIKWSIDDCYFNAFTTTLDSNYDYDDLSLEIIAQIDDKLTESILKDLKKFVKSLDIIKQKYDDDSIFRMLREILESYS